MKRFPLTLSVACLVVSLAVPSAWAGSFAAVNQSGNYNYTIVQQKAGKTRVMTKQIKPRRYANLNRTLANRTVKASLRQQVLGGALSGFGCGGGHGGNAVAVGQHGTGNSASAVQGGTNNLATSFQAGSNNASYIVQTGSNHTAHTTQTGNNNVTFVTQRC
jgi:hypothetical protein